MRGIRAVVVASLLCYASTASAALPDLEPATLVKAVQFADSLQKNLVCKYVVDEKFNMAVHAGKMPPERRLEIELREETDRHYIDVTSHDGKFIRGKPFRIVSAFNGENRVQWLPNENKGDIFTTLHRAAWPLPTYWGLNLGRHDSTLGQALEECKTTQVDQRQWEGHECYFVDLTQPNGARAEVWIDPKAGWRARHMRLYGADGQLQYESSTTEFLDCGNDSWFPMEGTAQMYGEDPATHERVVTCTRKLTVMNTQLNADLQRQDFDIQFPQGTEVYDHVHGIGFVKGVTSLDGISDQSLDEIVQTAKAGNSVPGESPDAGLAQTADVGMTADDDSTATDAGQAKEADHPSLPVAKSGTAGVLSVWLIVAGGGLSCFVLVILMRNIKQRRAI